MKDQPSSLVLTPPAHAKPAGRLLLKTALLSLGLLVGLATAAHADGYGDTSKAGSGGFSIHGQLHGEFRSPDYSKPHDEVHPKVRSVDYRDYSYGYDRGRHRGGRYRGCTITRLWGDYQRFESTCRFRPRRGEISWVPVHGRGMVQGDVVRRLGRGEFLVEVGPVQFLVRR
ncbi:MAG: hypothetical protein ACFCBW_16845 [Candidatus Competibacterales bacterium]